LLFGLAACGNGSDVRERTGASDVKITNAILRCVMTKDTQAVMDFLATPSGSEEEEIQSRPLLKSISKNCTDNAIVHSDVVDLRYRLKPMIN
jgi:uncharacterized protein YcgI (DUF1989 family)